MELDRRKLTSPDCRYINNVLGMITIIRTKKNKIVVISEAHQIKGADHMFDILNYA